MSLNVYEIITQRIVDSLEQGVVPWRTPWRSQAPQNFLTKKPYRGVNVFLLNTMRHTSPYWLTYRQAKAKGGSVRKGEHGTPIVFWKVYNPEDEKLRRFVLRYYTVFNLSQVDGIEVPPIDSSDSIPFEPIEECERIMQGYPNPPTIEYGGNQAHYIPGRDHIDLPPRESFESVEAFYATAFHELIHSTGHGDRLDRDGIVKLDHFGSHQYTKEELIAECGSSFLCGEAGILDTTFDNSAAYIAGWVKKLRSEPKWIVEAGGAAAKAADYILGRGKQAEETETLAGDEDA